MMCLFKDIEVHWLLMSVIQPQAIIRFCLFRTYDENTYSNSDVICFIIYFIQYISLIKNESLSSLFKIFYYSLISRHFKITYMKTIYWTRFFSFSIRLQSTKFDFIFRYKTFMNHDCNGQLSYFLSSQIPTFQPSKMCKGKQIHCCVSLKALFCYTFTRNN